MPTKKASSAAKKATIKSAAKKATKSVAKKTAAKKKSVTKPAAKKAATKKVTAKKANKEKKKLAKAKGASCFWTRDGLILENLITLKNALEQMPEDEFEFHVTKEKNDFADWVEQVLDDVECAAALRKSRKPNTAATVVVRHLRFYEI